MNLLADHNNPPILSDEIEVTRGCIDPAGKLVACTVSGHAILGQWLTREQNGGSMQQQIEFHGRMIELIITPNATSALAQRQKPLLAEMELYFSCLIRKSVRFYETERPDCTPALDGLSLCFRPVMTRHCGLDYEGDEPPLTDFPLLHPERYIPRWLRIDYENDQWHGEFGYAGK